MSTNADPLAKVAIITAASRGIGAACARVLHARGYRLALMSRTPAIHVVAKELGAVAIEGSVSNEADLAKLVKMTHTRYGRIDAVINNSGDPAGGQILEIPDEQWQQVFEMYFLSIVRMSRLVVPIMEAQGSGAFVNISGASALEPDMRFPVADTIRASMMAYTKLFAKTYAAKGIRMNNAAPSVMFDHEPDAVPARLKRELPIRRPAQYTEVANVVAFLLSDEASYISGETLKVDAAQTRGL